MAETRCDLCNIRLGTDIDVAKHILTDGHAQKRNKLIELHTIDKATQKEIPRDLVQLLQALKVRNVKDLRRLAAKGYFKIDTADNNEHLAKIAGDLSNALLRMIVQYDSRNLSARDREQISQVFQSNGDENDDEEAMSQEEDGGESEEEAGHTESQVIQEPKEEPKDKPVNKERKNANASGVNNNPESSKPNPKPLSESTYVPTLARIKIEPQD